METNREKLIKSLNIAINALESDIIHYDWTKQSSCNCGVVAQAVLGIEPSDLKLQLDPLFDPKTLSKRLDIKLENANPTWKNGVKAYCDITGQSKIEIFNKLFSAGLRIEDIAHLEYLENPAILKKANIKTSKTVNEPVEKITYVRTKNFFGLNKTKKIVTYVDTPKEINYNYFTEKSNLIKYLTAWAEILKEDVNTEISSEVSVDELYTRELIYVANEDFENATKTRDLIRSKLNK